MKEELEETVLDWLKTLTYKDNQITDSFIRGRADKPTGNSTSIVDYHQPISNKPKEHRIGSKRKEVIGQGTITLIYKAIDEEGAVIEEAEEYNDKIPDLISEYIFNDPSLGGTIPGEVIIIKQESGFVELKESEDNYPFISYLVFEYTGLWVAPQNV